MEIIADAAAEGKTRLYLLSVLRDQFLCALLPTVIGWLTRAGWRRWWWGGGDMVFARGGQLCSVTAGGGVGDGWWVAAPTACPAEPWSAFSPWTIGFAALLTVRLSTRWEGKPRMESAQMYLRQWRHFDPMGTRICCRGVSREAFYAPLIILHMFCAFS